MVYLANGAFSASLSGANEVPAISTSGATDFTSGNITGTVRFAVRFVGARGTLKVANNLRNRARCFAQFVRSPVRASCFYER